MVGNRGSKLRRITKLENKPLQTLTDTDRIHVIEKLASLAAAHPECAERYECVLMILRRVQARTT